MIPININKQKLNNNRKNDYLKNKAEEFYFSLTSKMRRDKLISVETWFEENFIFDNERYTFKEVVIADITRLKEIKQKIDILEKSRVMKIGYRLNNDYKEELDSILEYLKSTSYKNHINRVKFVENLDISVCPYCNRNYITNIDSNGRTTSQFDHYINKDSYPYFAVSFFNLIPVCSSCNHIKGINEIGVSPHDEYDVDEILKFNYEIIANENTQNHIEITIDTFNNEKIQRNIDVLHLDELYKHHVDIVEEIIKKYSNYNDTQIKEIYDLLRETGEVNGEEEVKRLVYGSYLDKDKFHKRPLSKLISDIVNQLEENSEG